MDSEVALFRVEAVVRNSVGLHFNVVLIVECVPAPGTEPDVVY